ncbi:MAG: NAD(P)/FAD-dependent oxidoreductase [Thermodesulfovibrionales bacterium]|nr:NAD(P)/FAD-dependent oxidoreductase [Nitrospinota bacterium]MCG2708818.1 NAD(P)/FAD-dependent oxidoreductase [Thermodesulfovibrionales bacterium]
MNTNVIIIGAGAAGLMCAIALGKRGRSVIILDHASKIGQKILVSGGGRCNFTNLNIQAENYLSANPHFCKSALARFAPSDFIAMVKKHRISHQEKENGCIFCNGSSRQIVDMLRDECNSVGVKMHLNCKIEEITRKNRFIVKTNSGVIESESLVVATGGLSYPNLGATDIGHRVASQFGLRIIPPKPALVPLTFSRSDREKFCELRGILLEAVVNCRGHEFRGEMLFTHKGLSGPAILQASSYWENSEEIIINLLPGIDARSIFLSNRQSKMEIKNLLSRYLPRRFAHIWCEFYLLSRPLCQYNDKELLDASRLLNGWIIKPAGTEGYRTAEVTRGGVDTDELSSKTMKAKKVTGLYFIGEVIDVTGHLGGYNLHWAWASGWTAGQYA